MTTDIIGKHFSTQNIIRWSSMMLVEPLVLLEEKVAVVILNHQFCSTCLCFHFHHHHKDDDYDDDGGDYDCDDDDGDGDGDEDSFHLILGMRRYVQGGRGGGGQ